ncbi:hypothetical protein DUNSADRAFT_7002 [Dunaliella salina]|uniref:Encoded protein n=1 Tax=Dunaliella salina TaxID=3046 RepID=A0ABQ7FTK8_DUNSA|nr:hypothetical protein DUNSADRAFT_7002 [Dunaliella salina]|eukprot:KAF5825780.1 hypothetical protein DUNSADRAFT_7002 [Dunaliella salina]
MQAAAAAAPRPVSFNSHTKIHIQTSCDLRTNIQMCALCVICSCGGCKLQQPHAPWRHGAFILQSTYRHPNACHLCNVCGSIHANIQILIQASNCKLQRPRRLHPTMSNGTASTMIHCSWWVPHVQPHVKSYWGVDSYDTRLCAAFFG